MKSKSEPWKVVIGATLFLIVFIAIVRFSSQSRLAKLCADLKGRGFKLTLDQLATDRKGSPGTRVKWSRRSANCKD